MAVDLLDYAPALRREITPLGTDIFEDVTDEDLVGYLTDAFWEARLEGLIPYYIADENGVVVSEIDHTFPDIPREQITIVVIYAGIRILRNRLINTNTSQRYTAGPVEYETSNSAAAIVEMLRQLNEAKKRFIELAQEAREMTGVTLIDAFSVRRLSDASYNGLLATVYGEVGQIASGAN